jgi:AAA15 family ATPase/GTPase
MTNFIEHIHIHNFKSLNACEINKCKRINLFIGRPNVGKSNIVEALSLFSIPYIADNATKKLSMLVRLENEPELFYNGNIERDAIIETNVGVCKLGYHPKEGLKGIVDFHTQSWNNIKIDEKLNVSGLYKHGRFEPPVKRYAYTQNTNYRKGHARFLIPPFGFNLFSIVEEYPRLKQDVTSFFAEYGLEIAFDKGSQTIKIIQKNGSDIFLIPYNSIADTLQRIIFYRAAIEANTNSVLLFEEPEAHAFPPYMSELTQAMIRKHDNQYFIATHSPFILNDLLENARKELAVFVVDFKERETKLRQLTENELNEVFQYGVDLFTNNESYL